MFKVAEANGYNWNFLGMLGRNTVSNVAHSHTVTMQLLRDLFGSYRTVVADTFYDCYSRQAIVEKRYLRH